MKKIMFSLMAVAAAAVITGCASVQVTEQADLNGMNVATSGKAIAHINAQN